MKLAVTLFVAWSVSGLLEPVLRPANSRILSQQGLEQFDKEQYAAAAALFEQSRQLRPTAEATFDLGTALVGAKDHPRAEQMLQSLAGDPMLAGPSWYNAGNSQLARGALDEAIESYTQALRLSPTNMSAKRNLEIALQRQEQQQQRNGSGGGDQENDDQEQGSPEQNEQAPTSLDPDVERILRSIDQQEREELSRMRRANAMKRPTDW